MKSDKLETATKEEILSVLIETEQRLLKATQNLGHPAYGLSSSTTFSIDELREDNFDYLEIPKTD